MSWIIGTVTLSPSAPDSVRETLPTRNDEFPISSGGYPTLIADGLGARVLRLQGELWKDGFTLADLLGSANQLGSYLGTTVAISSPYTRTDGTWLVTNMDLNIVATGGQARILYNMELKQGGSFLIL